MENLKRILSGRLVLGALSIALVLGVYQFATMQPDNNPALLPPIPNIVASFFTNIDAGALQTAIIIIWFGIEEFSRVLLISIACFMVCVVNVIAGMKNVPQVYVDAASTMGASRFQVFRTVAIPAATPFIITGYRIALGAAWTTLVAAELIAAPSGLGYMLQEGRRYFLTDQVMMIIVIIGACAFIMDRTFRAIQKRLMVWSEARE